MKTRKLNTWERPRATDRLCVCVLATEKNTPKNVDKTFWNSFKCMLASFFVSRTWFFVKFLVFFFICVFCFGFCRLCVCVCGIKTQKKILFIRLGVFRLLLFLSYFVVFRCGYCCCLLLFFSTSHIFYTRCIQCGQISAFCMHQWKRRWFKNRHKRTLTQTRHFIFYLYGYKYTSIYTCTGAHTHKHVTWNDCPIANYHRLNHCNYKSYWRLL